jgi:hypothetical protein
MSKHATMKSGPDLERALAELKAARIKVLDWKRVGREIFYKVMLPKPAPKPEEMVLLREHQTEHHINREYGYKGRSFTESFRGPSMVDSLKPIQNAIDKLQDKGAMAREYQTKEQLERKYEAK